MLSTHRKVEELHHHNLFGSSLRTGQREARFYQQKYHECFKVSAVECWDAGFIFIHDTAAIMAHEPYDRFPGLLLRSLESTRYPSFPVEKKLFASSRI